MTEAPVQRSRGLMHMARALWYTAPETVEIRSEHLLPAPPGWLTIQTHFSAISRGTERLVWSGRIAPTEWQRMRAPAQSGEFPFPVKYGYSSAGQVIDGPKEWIGLNTFALYPHQDIYHLTPERVVRVPDHIPLARATLAANMETALNGVWDSAAGPGDRIVVVGAGVIGLLIAYLTAALPGTKVDVIDPMAERRTLVESFGATFHTPGPDTHENLGADADVVFHASATAPGLQGAIDLAGFEARVVEMSWYGDRPVEVALGGAFHAKRLTLVSSQVGHVATNRRARWTHARRLETAAALLDDDRLDALLAGTIAFDELPSRIADILQGNEGGLSPVIAYDPAN
jgi:NADPH:quinone reductase-like Zn-dependent oxidoreductase